MFDVTRRRRRATADAIDAVVFDVGWVLVRLNYLPLLDCLRRGGLDAASMPDIVARIGLEAHECGRITGDELIDNLVSLAGLRVDRGEVRSHWTSMFEPVTEMLDLAGRLRATHRVHLLSNVGDLHWQTLIGSFGLDQLGHGALPSYEAGAMKPDERIYALAEERFGLTPARTVFIDDLAANVEAARRRGWKAIQHVDPAGTIAVLAELGIGV